MTDIRAVLDETDARFIARRLHAVQVARLDGDLGANEQTALHERLRRLEPAGLKRWEANDLVTKPMERLAIIATKRRPLREHLEALFFHARTVDAAFLRLILERSSAVGRIEAADKTDTHPVGTGFLIGRGLVMTCAHVLSSALKRGNGVQLRLCGASEERCLLLAPVVAIPSLDCAVLSVYADELVPTGLPLSARRPEVDGVLVGDHVTIIHHPRGGPLRFTIRDNDVVDVLPDHIHYVAETNPGSSGAPVLNDEGKVIGINTIVDRNAVSGDPAQGLGFAIPSNKIATVFSRLLSKGG